MLFEHTRRRIEVSAHGDTVRFTMHSYSPDGELCFSWCESYDSLPGSHVATDILMAINQNLSALRPTHLPVPTACSTIDHTAIDMPEPILPTFSMVPHGTNPSFIDRNRLQVLKLDPDGRFTGGPSGPTGGGAAEPPESSLGEVLWALLLLARRGIKRLVRFLAP